jgi:aminopeptidase N
MLRSLCLFFVFASLLVHAQPSPPYYNSENLRSDTFNILKYTISLEIGDQNNPVIGGNTAIRFTPLKNNLTFIPLDLLRLTVDSVKEGNASLSFAHNDTLLKVNFASPKNVTDTSLITVYYHGMPVMDATGWGGFYFNNTQGAQYAWNLGVGFGAEPHNYGRVWFPCFDNFVERSRYEYFITTDSLRRAFCSGDRVGESISGSKRICHWKLDQEIPSYLASVAVARYTQVKWTANTLTGQKPVLLAAHASDTTGLKVAFVNLQSCITGFESYYGPYRWNRVGYALIPFNGGAMEHASNIGYPRAAIGSLAFEELWAHELSHHWWGDLVTCETPEDMWINEGMASFSADLFFEWQYDKTKYLERIKSRHDDLLHFLHKREGGFLSISGNGHDLTYSDHVYKKGADAVHTLRGYMGDAAFFAACKYVLQQKQFTHANSNDIKTLMQTSSGQNLGDFFDAWIFSGGWSQFALDSVRYKNNGNTTIATVAVRQRLYGTALLHKNVPLEVSFFRLDRTRTVQQFTMNGPAATFTFSLPFQPVYCALNYDSKVSDASSHEVKKISSNSVLSYTLGKVTVTVQSAGSDTTLLRVVHNYVRPEAFKNNPAGHILSDQHYWTIEGVLSPGFKAAVRFVYDGTKNSSGSNTYMDTLLTRYSPDSIALFFRKDASDEWTLLRNVVKTKFGGLQGYLDLDSLMTGEYTFGNFGDTSTVGIKNYGARQGVRLYPNPATHQVTVDVSGSRNVLLEFMDGQGRIVMRRELVGGKTILDLSQLSKGAYAVKVEREGKLLSTEKLILH